MPIGTYTPPPWKTITQNFFLIFLIYFFHFRCILLQISHKKCFFISISILGRSGVKKGDRKEAKNYRPISLTSVCGKVLESIVRDKIVSHMMTNNLFCDEQHGFVPGRSCVTQLLCVMEMWTNSLNSREEIDCIYLDFQKAFDTVPHARLN